METLMANKQMKEWATSAISLAKIKILSYQLLTEDSFRNKWYGCEWPASMEGHLAPHVKFSSV